MLKAVMAGHASFQPVIAGDHPARREGRQGAARTLHASTSRRSRRRCSKSARPICAPPIRSPSSRSVTRRSTPSRRRCSAALLPAEGEAKFTKEEVAEAFHNAQAKVVRWNILDHGRRIDGRDLTTVRPIDARGRRAAAHPRLGLVHPRRDAGARGRDARHRRGRAVHRRAGRHLQGALPAALQLPSLQRRRDRPHGRAGAARDRPRQARLARDPSDAADAGRVPLHDPRRLGDHRVRTAPRRWRPSAAPRSR